MSFHANGGASTSLLVGLASTVLMASVGCRGDATSARPEQRVVVEIAGSAMAEEQAVITETEYRAELARVRLEREGTLNAAPLSTELKEAILDRMVDEHLLMSEAIKKGVKVSTVAVGREIAAMRAAFPPKQFERQLVETYQTEEDLARAVRTRLLAAQLLKVEAFQAIKVSDDELKKAWEALPADEKVRPARVHAAQIVVHTEEEGREVIGLLKKGKDFAEVAREKSVAPEAVRGGDLGWFEAGVMPSVFDEVCFALKPGSTSELTASEYGFHIFKLLDAQDQVPLGFDEARPQLEQKLREEAVRTAENNYKTALRAKVKIVRNDELIASIE